MRIRAHDLPQLPGVTHRHVDVRDVRLHVAEAGAGPPLVLLHGWPQHWWCWRRLVDALAQEHRVLMPDLRGFGWSDAPPGDYAKTTFAADVVALLDAEGIDRARLIGHDWGAYTALLLALEHPDRVERLVALDVVPPWTSRSRPSPRLLGLPRLAAYQVMLAAPVIGQNVLTRANGFVHRLIRAASGPDAEWTDAELDVYGSVLREPTRARASSACYRTFLTRELPAIVARGDRSSELEVPSLLVMGETSLL
jgi:pimeloyl-ACP methyl ester carboxylesterase